MRRPNILLVVLDATRADACSCYGCERPTTPVLDKLAAEGTLFEQAISPAPWTLPAIASLFTGLFPSQMGMSDRRILSPSFSTLAQHLSQNGYATFGITNNSWLSADFGLQRGFDTMHKQWQWLQTSQEINQLVLMERSQGHGWARTVLRELAQGNLLRNVVNAAFTRLVAYRRDLGASRILRPLESWIASQQGPWFAFVHYMEAHLPYKPPLKWVARFTDDLEQARHWIRSDQWRAARRHIAGVELLSETDLALWRDLYLAEVAYTDHCLGQLVDWLQRTGRLDDTLVIAVADHGENLGEHGLLNHQYCVYDTLLRVPMVMRCPALLPAGRRVSHQVQTLDLFRTILDVAGIEAPFSASKDLRSEDAQRSFVVGENGIPRVPHPRDLARFGLQSEQLARFARGLTALRTDTHKLIVGTDGTVELYAWRDDPGEENNLASRHPEVVDALQKMLARWQEEHQVVRGEEREERWEVDNRAVEARLRALGYIE
jgi:arylsulfatase A-like enzyme